MKPLSLFAITLLLGCTHAQDRISSVADISQAEAILDRHVEATGGKPAYAKHDYRVSTGSVLYKDMGTLSILTIHATRSGDRLWHSRSESLGDQLEGSDGSIAWTSSLMSGTLLKQGPGLEHALRNAPIDAVARWRELFERVEHAGTTEVEGKTLQAVTLVSRDGSSETRYFDAQTGLHFQTEYQADLNGNLLTTLVTYSDYRMVDDLLLPHSIHENTSDLQDKLTELTRIVHEEDPPGALFEPPTAVRALLDR